MEWEHKQRKGMMRKMKNEPKKAPGTSRRVMAFVMAAALCLSTLAAASPAKAAGFTKPKLAVKKKTLYYNKAGRKTYTLKVNSNKVKKIVSTTWKTSKKSIVSISKKKKMSVKLTAKKRGTATVTAKVRYVPKGKWMVRTISLKCKVTSKSAAISKATPAPVNKATPKPTTVPKMSPAPTNIPNSQQAAKVELDQNRVVFTSTEDGENTKVLTAVVKNAQGKAIKNQKITWSTDNDKVAKVEDGVVTAKKEGMANITASVDKIKSEPCAVIVDTTAPAIEGARITDYKTITVYFDESVEGNPEVSVTRSSGDLDNVLVRMTPVLAEDGQSMTLVSTSALQEGTYNLEIAGLTDSVGNKLASSKKTVIKETSNPQRFVCRTKEIPAGQEEVMVYFKVVDQYGEELRNYVIKDLKAAAETESGMPLDISVEEGKDCVKISGAIGMLAKGKKVLITLSSKSLGVEDEFSTTLVDSEGVGIACEIDRISAVSEAMSNSGDSEAPQFALTTDEKQNVFTLGTELLDKFGGPANSKVVYVINDNTGIIEFADIEGSNSKDTNICNSDKPVSVKARKKGVVTITVYLASDDSQRRDITITIRPTALKKITVGELSSGYNMQESQAKITLDPIGTGITAKDLIYEPADDISRERIEKIQFMDAEDGSGEIYVSVTAAADSKSDPIRFIVCYMEDGLKITTSNEVTYMSSPMPLVDKIKVDDFEETISCHKEVKTAYRLLNRYGENITDIAKGELKVDVSQGAIGKLSDVSAKEGTLTVTGESVGQTTITLKYENISETVTVVVKDTAVVQVVNIAAKQANGEPWELIEALNETVYIPVSFLDQYKNKISVTGADWSTALPTVIINGNPASNGSATDIEINPVTPDPSAVSGYKIATSTDKVEAIEVKYSIDVSNGGVKPSSKIFTFAYDHSGVEKFSCNTATVYLRPEREATKLVFEDNSKTALPGATYDNKVTVLDQYGDELKSANLPSGKTVQYKVFNAAGNEVSGNPLTFTGTTSTLGSGISAGTYTVTAYLGDGTENDISKLVRASYTLKVGSVEDLAHSIKIDDTIDSSGTKKKISDVDYIKIADSSSSTQTSLTLTYTLYDKDGLKIETPNTGYGISDGELGWSASGTNIDTSIEDGVLKANFEGNADTGAIMIELNYTPGGIKKGSLAIPVSCKDSVIKTGSYKIQESGRDVDLKDAEVLSASPVTYSVVGTDQYGDTVDAGVLYSVYAKDKSVATVAKVPASHRFTVEQVANVTAGKETVVVVQVTEKEVLEMKVKAS